MDAKKALLRSRMREVAAAKKDKEGQSRVETPLVRYNELGQPFCKLCKITVKSEALWPVHLRSSQHQEAAEELKARAHQGPKSKPKPAEHRDAIHSEFKVPSLPSQNDESKKVEHAQEVANDVKQPEPEPEEVVKGGVPQGFFDNMAADMKARGLQLPKRDLKEELQEFQRSIEEDVKAIDERQLEEELEELEYKEEGEEIEQKAYMERVERVEQLAKRRKLTTAAAAAAASETPKSAPREDVDLDKLLEDLSSDDESEDWRVKPVF